MALDEIVWAVNPTNDTYGALANYFSHFAEQFLQSTGINCRFDVSDAMPASPLGSDQRHGLFLAFKEALNNAVRHSRAKNVTLRIGIANGQVQVVVEDDGIGFNQDAKRPGADGLAGMQTRMSNLGGSCKVSSEPGKGTRVQFQLPIHGGATYDA